MNNKPGPKSGYHQSAEHREKIRQAMRRNRNAQAQGPGANRPRGRSPRKSQSLLGNQRAKGNRGGPGRKRGTLYKYLMTAYGQIEEAWRWIQAHALILQGIECPAETLDPQRYCQFLATDRTPVAQAHAKADSKTESDRLARASDPEGATTVWTWNRPRRTATA